MKIKYLVYTLLVLGLGALIAFRIHKNSSDNDKSKGGKDKNKPTLVTGVIVVPQVFENSLSLSGSIQANEQVDIRSEVSGVVQGIFFEEGSQVTKGQVLFKVNDIELRAQLRQQQTKESLAAENDRRAGLLLKKEAISQEEYDTAHAELKSAQAQTQLIQAQLAKTQIRAPFSGKIGLRSISPGTYVTPETVVAKLVNVSQLKLTFSIPEKYAGQMKLGTVIDFTVAGSAQKYTAKISAIEPEITEATRTLQIRAVASNTDGKLLPGTFADIELPLQKINDAIVIPSQAIVPVQDGKKVFTVLNGKAHENKVETETRTDKDVLILSGLKAGDTVLTTGVMSLKDKAPVKVKLQKN